MMLPKEVGSLFTAVTTSTAAKLDAQRLGAELAGLATFHQSLLDSGVLTPDQRALFHKWRTGTRQDLGLTAPPEGPPEIHLKITAPAGGPPIIKASTKRLIVCPKCGKSFMVKL